MTYIIKGFLKFVEEDTAKDGCLPDSGFSTTADVDLTSDSKEDILDEVKAFFDVSDDDIVVNACDEDGRIDIQILESADTTRASEEDIASWSLGDKRLWLVTYSGQLQSLTSEKF